MDPRRAPAGWWQALAAAGMALIIDALYLVIIWNEGEGELTSGRVLFVAGCLAAAALALTWGLVLGPRIRAVLFTAATATLAVWMVLGAFSIGLLLVPAVVFAALATGKVNSGSRGEAAFAALAPVVIVAAGLALT
ncbi:MAG TPA: hypothetical protein VNB65_01865 [Gaiellaceae bacterium]|nr:hypothetical protein [Gaiellaceae bacterium]